MNLRLLYILFGLVLVSSDSSACFRKRKKAKAANQSIINDQSRTAQSFTFVSFISIGSGIDFKAFEGFEKGMKDFEKQNNCSLSFQVKTWGREGERDYCISSQQAECLKSYTQEIRKKYQGNERIFIEEVQQCKQRN
jgi:hypothetical protein